MRNKLMKIAGKGDFQLDGKIPTLYVLRLCFRYGFMMVRGFFRGHPGTFIGRHVHFYCCKALRIGYKAKIRDNVKINALSTHGVSIGANCVIGEGTVIECTGSLEQIGKGLIIGDRTAFAAGCYFGAAGGIEIGEDVIVGQMVRFHSENHRYSDRQRLIRDQGVTHKGIKIGNNCWIGSGVVFLDGAEVGDGCVVAANAVVTQKFKDNLVVGGVPAKVIKFR